MPTEEPSMYEEEKVQSESRHEERFRQAVSDTGRGGGIGFVALFFGKGASFGLHTLLARLLGPAGYGLFALGRAIMNIGGSIAKLGTDVGIVRFVSQGDAKGEIEESAAIFRTAVIVATLGGGILAGALFIGAPFLNTFFDEQGLEPVLQYFAVALPAYSLLTVTTSVLQARKYIAEQQGILRLLTPVVKALVIGGAFFLGMEVKGIVAAFAISGFLSLSISLYIIWKHFAYLFELKQWRLRIRKLLRYSVPVMLSGVGSMLAMRVDRILLGSLGTAEGVGVYNVAALVGINMAIVKASIIPVLKPVLSEAYYESTKTIGEGHFKKIYCLATKWVFLCTFVIALPILSFPDLVMSIFGKSYVNSAPVLVIFIVYGISKTVFGPTIPGLKMSGHQDLELINSVILLVSIVVLDLLLIPKYGAVGAALGTLIATTLVSIVRVIQINKVHNFQPFSGEYVALLVVCAISGLVMYLSLNIHFAKRLPLLVVAVVCIASVFIYTWEDQDYVLVSLFKQKITSHVGIV